MLICIDTLSRALCGGDENSCKDIGALVNATARLQDAAAAHVLWVHHMPQESKANACAATGRCSGALDTTIHVVKAADGIRTATVIKANDSEEGERVVFHARKRDRRRGHHCEPVAWSRWRRAIAVRPRPNRPEAADCPIGNSPP